MTEMEKGGNLAQVRWFKDAAAKAQQAGNWLAAAGHHRKLMALEPDDAQHRVRLGHCLERARKLDEAAHAWISAAVMFKRSGQKAKAAAVLALVRRVGGQDLLRELARPGMAAS